jgi:hypothetical protein
MLMISRKNSTRFVDSKRSCEKRSRKYDARRKRPSVVEKIELDENGQERSLGLPEHLVE